jgi:tetratricopeptide (TPR) repeat protein
MGLFLARYDLLEDAPAHRQLLEECLAMSRETDFYLGTSLALQVSGGRNQELLEMAREADDRRGMAFALMNLGEEAHARQEYAQAKELYQESLALVQDIGTRWGIGQLHVFLGDVALIQGAHQTADEHYRQAMTHYRRSPFDTGITGALDGLGRLALARNDPEEAAGHYRQALQIAVQPYFQQIGQEAKLRLQLVVSIAALLARTDEELAVELAALARDYPSTAVVTETYRSRVGLAEARRRARALLEDLEDQFPSAVFVAAVERGGVRDLEATLSELLEELGCGEQPSDGSKSARGP